MSGPRGLVKCCLKVLGFELPSCLVKGFFPPLLSSISIFYKEHGEAECLWHLHIKIRLAISILPRELPASLRPVSPHTPLLRRQRCLALVALIPPELGPGEMKRPSSFESGKLGISSFSWEALEATDSRGSASHLCLKRHLEGRPWMRTCIFCKVFKTSGGLKFKTCQIYILVFFFFLKK